jgi:FlaA1/EpsC-like NDP-sugar epimerase
MIKAAEVEAYVPGELQRQLDAAIVERTTSLFSPDLEDNRERIGRALTGRRVLVVGGGGSIGSMTARLLLQYEPRAVHVIDLSENYLAELVRDIRSSTDLRADVDLRLFPIDFGGPVAQRLIRDEAPYDIVLNFAALKHVRSEKDVYSLLQMLDTNIVRQARFKRWVVERGGTTRYFGVSTDKAANPTSLMGASKRLMEDVLFGVSPCDTLVVTSARFANVAFSNGSLLQSWLQRLQLGQALAVPRDTRRYFVTQLEAGEICVLASLLGDNGEIFIPRLDPERELRLLETLAARMLRLHGFEPVAFEDEAEARRALSTLRRERRWPLLLTPLDTSGEKPFEEFVGKGERAHEVDLKQLLGIRHAAIGVDEHLIGRLEKFVSDVSSGANKSDIVAAVASAVQNFHHVETDRSLDHRM